MQGHRLRGLPAIPEDERTRHQVYVVPVARIGSWSGGIIDLAVGKKPQFLQQLPGRKLFSGMEFHGAVIVTADEITDPQALDLRTWVNGELKQSANTRMQVFDVATVLSILSRGMPLEPGDIISTGTPGGVGFARTPPEFLRPGDLVECEVEGIGRLRNRVR